MILVKYKFMALENALKIYLSKGESSEIIEKLKELGVCLESFFNHVQIIKSGLNTKIYFKDIYTAGTNAGFDEVGEFRTNFVGSRIKMVYSYFDGSGMEHTGFILLNA